MGGTRELVICASLLALVVGVSAGVLGWPEHARASRPAVHPDGLPDDLDQMPATSAGPAPDAPAPTSLAARQLAALSASDRPADAYLVYRLLANCALARGSLPSADFQAHVGAEPSDVCAGVDAGQIERRVEWLRVAVSGGVPGAAADLLSQGPDGQPLVTVWNDPRYAAWRRDALATVNQAVSHGDREALLALSRLYAEGGLPDDGQQAIKYAVAWADVVAAANPAFARPAERARAVAQVLDEAQERGAQLSDQQKAAAVAAGHALSADCCGA